MLIPNLLSSPQLQFIGKGCYKKKYSLLNATHKILIYYVDKVNSVSSYLPRRTL